MKTDEELADIQYLILISNPGESFGLEFNHSERIWVQIDSDSLELKSWLEFILTEALD